MIGPPVHLQCGRTVRGVDEAKDHVAQAALQHQTVAGVGHHDMAGLRPQGLRHTLAVAGGRHGV
jgi:hypothetical protein